jgi:hypothetical protein
VLQDVGASRIYGLSADEGDAVEQAVVSGLTLVDPGVSVDENVGIRMVRQCRNCSFREVTSALRQAKIHVVLDRVVGVSLTDCAFISGIGTGVPGAVILTTRRQAA